MADGERSIYIIIVNGGTIMSKLTRIYTKQRYTHVSIALDNKFNQMYSVSRLNRRLILPAGFVKEDLETKEGIIYEIKINEGQYKQLVDTLQKYISNPREYKYNIVGLMGVLINKPIERERHFFCSQFVNKVLIDSDIQVINKEPGLTTPKDIIDTLGEYEVYRGILTDYRECLGGTRR